MQTEAACNVIEKKLSKAYNRIDKHDRRHMLILERKRTGKRGESFPNLGSAYTNRTLVLYQLSIDG